MQSEEALAFMLLSTVETEDTNTDETMPEEDIVEYDFDVDYMSVSLDDTGSKKYLLSGNNYVQNIVVTDDKIVLLDNILTIDSPQNIAVYDSRIRQIINVVSGGIEYG